VPLGPGDLRRVFNSGMAAIMTPCSLSAARTRSIIIHAPLRRQDPLIQRSSPTQSPGFPFPPVVATRWIRPCERQGPLHVFVETPAQSDHDHDDIQRAASSPPPSFAPSSWSK